jgi:pyrimidine-nucleoside phosphorylase
MNVRLSVQQIRDVLTATHLCFAGQTSEIAPADRKLYALRDVTATIESIPLIASSILSKKLAEGIDALVFDVKVGSGAFMKRHADALALARTLVRIGTNAGKKIVALITDMEQPLGTHIGNTLEVIDSVKILQGQSTSALATLSYELAAHLLVLGEVAATMPQARRRVRELIQRGLAYRKFQEVVAAQGGDVQALETPPRLPTAHRTETVVAATRGYVQRIDAEAIGVAGMLLGAGRATVEATIDHGAGIVLHSVVGDQVEAGSHVATLYFNDASGKDEARERVAAAFVIDAEPPPKTKLIRRIIAEE